MSTLDTLNTAAESLGGRWVKLNRREHGTIEGALKDFEIRPKTFESKPVLSSKTGEQRSEWVLTLKVTPEDDDDDGIRKLSLNESAQRALAKAIKDSKAKAATDGIVKMAVLKDPATDREQAEYQAKYTPPAPVSDAALDSVFGDDEPTEPF